MYASHTFTFDTGTAPFMDGDPCDYEVTWERVGEYGQPDEWEATATFLDMPFGAGTLSRKQAVEIFGKEAVTKNEDWASEHFTECGLPAMAAE